MTFLNPRTWISFKSFGSLYILMWILFIDFRFLDLSFSITKICFCDVERGNNEKRERKIL